MKEQYIEKIYAGWLAKIIGIRLGAPVEGWTYEKIRNIYGELTDYPVDYREFAADDDSNGPLFFLRALEDGGRGKDMTAQDVGDALLNYAPFEHGFFWWGGYGISTEHTAYLNLKNGMPAPRSGSVEQNGPTTAEQIGGQIFIDAWGLAAPGRPDLAARLAERAASVTHGGNGVYGGIFVAVCISWAFVEKDIKKIIEKGLSYIPEDCEYARVVRAVVDFYEKNMRDGWRKCYDYVRNSFGYDRYPGNCHIIPNIAVMILALLYGEGDFSDTLNICNMCGWDTDCNVGNIATIMGVRNGLEGIDFRRWRAPINDFLACSSVMGSMNLMDIPFGALYITKMACELDGQRPPEPWRTIIRDRIDSCHFEFPGSTHAIRTRVESLTPEAAGNREVRICNTEETAYTGKRCLKLVAKPVEPGERIYVYKKTYYVPADFHDSRYDPAFSPLAYPGQTIHGAAFLPEYGEAALVSLYARDEHTGKVYESERVAMEKGEWKDLEFSVPELEGALIDEVGFCFHAKGDRGSFFEFVGMIDDLYVDGEARYSLDFSREREEVWTGLHREISQCTRLKGLACLEGGSVHLGCPDFGELYTGHHEWRDYRAVFYVTPETGERHYVNVRVQGAMRSYAFGFLPGNRIALLKKEKEYRVLTEGSYEWEPHREYCVHVTAVENRISAEVEGGPALEYTDETKPYRKGGIGIAVEEGSRIACRRIRVDRAGGKEGENLPSSCPQEERRMPDGI